MFSTGFRAALASLLLASGAPLALQEANVSASDAAFPTACELHVWPSKPVRSTYSGWFHGGIVDGAVQGRDGYRKLPDSILSPEAQLQALAEIDLAATLKMPGYAIVLHEEVLPSRMIRTAQTRLQPGTPLCYAELVTDDVFFQQDIIDGRFLKAIFRFRQFDGGDTPSRSFGTYTQVRLTQFPPAEPEQLDAALEEFRKAYGTAAREFGEALNRPPKKKNGAKAK